MSKVSVSKRGFFKIIFADIDKREVEIETREKQRLLLKNLDYDDFLEIEVLSKGEQADERIYEVLKKMSSSSNLHSAIDKLLANHTRGFFLKDDKEKKYEWKK